MKVAVEDQFGNVVTTDTSTVTLTVATGPGGFANGSTTSVAAVKGIATFSNLLLDTAGSYTLNAADGSLASATSGNLVLTPAAPAKAVFQTLAGGGFAVVVEDQFNNVVTSYTGPLNLQGSATLPLIGAVTLSGTITSPSNYSFSGTIPTVTAGGFILTNDTVTLANGVVGLQGTATLPLVGSVTLAGTITDANDYSFSTSVPLSVTVGALSLTDAQATVANGMMGLQGNVSLPLASSVHVSGTVTDATDFSLTATGVQFGTFLQADIGVTWDATR